MTPASRLGSIAAIGALYLLHQDFWWWDDARPLVLGVVPVGLAYHAMYCVAVALLMWALTRHAWPIELEGAEPGVDRASDPRREAHH